MSLHSISKRLTPKLHRVFPLQVLLIVRQLAECQYSYCYGPSSMSIGFVTINMQRQGEQGEWRDMYSLAAPCCEDREIPLRLI